MSASTFIDLVFGRQSVKVPTQVTADNGHIYVIEEQIGAGGNAVVCQCTDQYDGNLYAIKFLASTRDNSRLPRFHLETQLLRTLSVTQHDHLIRFITNGEVEGRVFDFKRKRLEPKSMPFFIMERASQTLREFIVSSEIPIPPEIYFAQFRGLVSALELLHRHAIHRDIKPENILVVGERWAISDFGLCTNLEVHGFNDLTQAGQIPGPRFWMSPEANNRHVGLDDEINYASDVFQLAAVFWWVVNRRHPSGVLAREDWLGIDSLYDPIVTALQHSQRRRYETASQFRTAIIKAISL